MKTSYQDQIVQFLAPVFSDAEAQQGARHPASVAVRSQHVREIRDVVNEIMRMLPHHVAAAAAMKLSAIDALLSHEASTAELLYDGHFPDQTW